MQEIFQVLEHVARLFRFHRFLQFDLEDSDNCNRDYVEIHRDSAEGPILGHFCGNAIPANVTTAEKLWIKFNSDSANTAGGFIAQYNLRELTLKELTLDFVGMNRCSNLKPKFFNTLPSYAPSHSLLSTLISALTTSRLELLQPSGPNH